ncbi:phage BR0599 family protein [Arenimonas fontis]|uniref:DUF2163 domain-containing protein n=1 Tax=Arenimonas fontis TaxID=2608255 RepID=A0A5B2ZCW2_9GAMM|nr:phage BR0599 family protein [Arenimonas fontis]KAA2285423.1 DUF2163 domain-containing protein [Arenimonas fontis]
MTYDATERSADQGRPVELYTFHRDAKVYRFTSADRAVAVGGNTFLPRVIRRGSIEQGAELNRSGLKLSVPRDFEIAALYQAGAPSSRLALTLQQYHAGDGELAVLWSGAVLSCSFGVGSQAEISLEPSSVSMRRPGLRRTYQRQCPHVLYRCGVNADDHKVVATVTAVAGLQVSAAEFAGQPDGYWEGGYLEYEIETGVWERRFILGHTGTAVGVDLSPIGLSPSMTMNFYPGCDHSLATCDSKFNNAPGYGGMPYIPTKNPYGSDPVY